MQQCSYPSALPEPEQDTLEAHVGRSLGTFHNPACGIALRGAYPSYRKSILSYGLVAHTAPQQPQWNVWVQGLS